MFALKKIRNWKPILCSGERRITLFPVMRKDSNIVGTDAFRYTLAFTVGDNAKL